MKFQSIVFFCVFVVFAGRGQDSWRTGEIKLRSDKVVNGLINDKEWVGFFEVVEFKENENSLVIHYTPSELHYFKTDRSKYESHVTSFDGDKQDITDHPDGRLPKSAIKGHFFLEVLVDAPIGLLTMTDANGRSHFFYKKDTAVSELLNRMYKNDNPRISSEYFKTNAQYKQDFLRMANACPDMRNRIQNAKYNTAFLVKIVQLINKCNGFTVPSLVSSRATKGAVLSNKKKPQFGFMGEIFTTHATYLRFYTRMNKLNSGWGVTAEFFSRKRPNRFSLNNEILYKKLDQQYYRYAYLPRTGQVVVEKVKVRNTIRSSYFARGGRFFWDIGISNGVSFNAKVDGVADEFYYPAIHEIGIVLGVGRSFNVKNLQCSLLARFESDQAPFSKNGSRFVDAQNLGIVLTISFINR